MNLKPIDFIILGQGLAGTALAWSLSWNGSRVLVIDRDSSVTSSKIAAGLITPITGQRLVKTWRFDELWPAAVSFYRRVEQATGTSLFRQTPMVRLFQNLEEAETCSRRSGVEEFRAMVRSPEPPLDLHDVSDKSQNQGEPGAVRPRVLSEIPESGASRHPAHWTSVGSVLHAFVGEQSGFEMPCAGQLDVPQYLSASREHFTREGQFQTSDLDLIRDLELDEQGVRLPRLGVRSRRLIFCQGIDAVHNPWFRSVRFRPAKGEILTVRVPGLSESRVIHRGVWLAPLGGEVFRVGSTYEWHQLDNVPTPTGRDEIVSRLREFLRLPFEVLNHQAAVRPIHLNQYPVLGQHPDFPQLGYFNGLGSKGTLHAPYFASHFARVLSGAATLDPEVDLNRKTDLHGCRP